MKSSTTTLWRLPAILLATVVLATSCVSTPEPSEPDESATPNRVHATTGYMEVQNGKLINSFANGVIVQIGGANLPAPYGNDSIIIETELQYWLDGSFVSSPVQLMLGGVIADSSLKVGQHVDADTVLGAAASNELLLNIRATFFEPYLSLCSVYGSQRCEFVNDWFYYGTDLFQQEGTFLDFQPLANADDGYQFWDQPESLREIYEDGYSSYQKNGSTISTYPNMTFAIQTVLKEYPASPSMFTTNVSPMQRIMIENEMGTSSSVALEWEGIPLQIYVPDHMIAPLQNDYTLGNPVWLYLYANRAVNGELCCWMWDFSNGSPSENAQQANQMMVMYMMNTILSY